MYYKHIFIPIEIQHYILSKISRTDDYKNARFVCKDWYNELKILKLFNNYKIIKYIKFFPEEILVYNSNNQILERNIFKRYGESIYYKYHNNKCIKKILCFPLKSIETTYYNNIPYEKHIYNIKHNTLKTVHLPFPFAFPHPIERSLCTIS